MVSVLRGFIFPCSFKKQQLEGDVFFVGGISVLSASPDLNRMIQDLSLPLPESGFLHTFYRVLIGSQMFYTANYGRVKKRNSFTVAFHKDHVTRQKFFGKIQLFIIINNHAYVFISCLVPDSTSSFHAFI